MYDPNRLFFAVALVAATACTAPEPRSSTSAAPAGAAAAGLSIGVLFDESGQLGYYGSTGRPGVELAIDHLNQAGGVLGHPARALYADTKTDIEASVAAARTLVDAGVHALVGPLGSAAVIAVTSRVAAPDGIPIVTPTATSPDLSHLDDGGFLFRTTASDLVQAPVLARLAEQEGARHLAAFYQDDSYGRGLARALATSFSGPVTTVPIGDEVATFVADIERAAAAGADTLVAMSYVPSASVYLREAQELGAFERFLMADATASLDLVDELGAEAVEGIKGTAPSGTMPWLDADLSTGSRAFEDAFVARFGRPPTNQLEAAAYDITLCFALAAEKAGTTDGARIRDALPRVCGADGELFGPGAAPVRDALAALRAGHDVVYRGISGRIAWDDRGDLAVGTIVVWQFANGDIEAVATLPFDLREPTGRAAVAP